MRNFSLLLCSLAVFFVPALDARSEILDGSYTIEFTGPQSLWPLEDIDFCESEDEQGVSVEICVDFSFVPDGAGGVSGTGSVTITLGGLVSANAVLLGTIVGKSKGSDTSGVKQSVSFKLSGPLTIQTQTVDLSIAGKLSTLVSSTGLATTTGTVSVGIKGFGSAKAPIETPIVEQLPSGDWSAVLDITPDPGGQLLTGTIDLVLPGGTVQIPLSGKYNAKKDSSSIKAKGTKGDPDQKGLAMALKNVVGGGVGALTGEAKAKVQGVKIGGPVVAAP